MILSIEKYQKTVKRAYPPLLASLVLKGITNADVYNGLFSIPFSRKDSLICDGVWYNNAEAEDLGRNLIKSEWISSKHLQKFISLCKKRENLLLHSTSKTLSEFTRAFEYYMVSLTLVFLAEQPFYEKLKEKLLLHVSRKEAEDILMILNVPFNNNYHKQEEYDLLMTKNLKSHIKKYSWLLSRNGDLSEYSFSEAHNKLLSINKKEYLAEYKVIKKEVSLTIKKAKKIIGRKFAYLVDGLQFVVFYRTHRTDVLNRALFMLSPKLIAFSKQYNLSYEDVLHCSIDEITSSNIPSKKVINQRKQGYALTYENDRFIFFVGSKLKQLISKLEIKISISDVIKGFSACGGLKKGKVINVDESNFSLVNDGDILVTSMTTPKMISAMKKAGAIVTDEGGVTCHAAIVARELKIPCIIGTKIATKVLKDGDLVEVDAEKGVVTILKRAK